MNRRSFFRVLGGTLAATIGMQCTKPKEGLDLLVDDVPEHWRKLPWSWEPDKPQYCQWYIDKQRRLQGKPVIEPLNVRIDKDIKEDVKHFVNSTGPYARRGLVQPYRPGTLP